MVCRPLQNPHAFQPPDCSLCRCEGDTEFAGNARGGNEGIGGQQIEDPQGGIGGLARDLSLPLGKNYVDTTCTAQLSRCTQMPDSRLFVFNPFPGFDCSITALKSRTVAHKTRTKFLLKFVRDISTKMTLSFLLASVSVRDLSTNRSANSGN